MYIAGLDHFSYVPNLIPFPISQKCLKHECAYIAHYSANSLHNSAPVQRNTVLVTKNTPNLSFYHLTFSVLPCSWYCRQPSDCKITWDHFSSIPLWSRCDLTLNQNPTVRPMRKIPRQPYPNSPKQLSPPDPTTRPKAETWYARRYPTLSKECWAIGMGSDKGFSVGG